jgi:hypothetical protein
MVSSTNCSTTQFVIDQEELVTGKIITFKDQTPNATEWEWTFGDSSKTVTNKEALHAYKHPGEYVVKLRVNGGCTVQKKITVTTDNQKKKSESNLYPSFEIPASAYVGESIQFRDNTEGAEEWQWSFGESMQIDATSQNPAYEFTSSGTKTVTLIVNGRDEYAAQKRITVFAKPIEDPEFDDSPSPKIEIEQKRPEVNIPDAPTAQPLQPIQEPEKAPELSPIQLEDYLLQIAAEEREPMTLKPFVCKEYKTRVRANGNESTLQVLLQQFKGNEIKIKNLEIAKNEQTRCISFIKIDYSTDKVLGIF